MRCKSLINRLVEGWIELRMNLERSKRYGMLLSMAYVLFLMVLFVLHLITGKLMVFALLLVIFGYFYGERTESVPNVGSDAALFGIIAGMASAIIATSVFLLFWNSLFPSVDIGALSMGMAILSYFVVYWVAMKKYRAIFAELYETKVTKP